MQTIDAIAEILKREGVKYLSCFPTTPVIEACAAAGIRPIICRQERVGVGIADGYSRITNGRPPGVSPCSMAPAPKTPTPASPLLSPTRCRSSCFRWAIPASGRASSRCLTPSRASPALPSTSSASTCPAAPARSCAAPSTPCIPADPPVHGGNPCRRGPRGRLRRGILLGRQRPPLGLPGRPRRRGSAARALCSATYPVIHAGQGVMYAEASDELVELAELLSVPVMTTLWEERFS